MRVGSRWLHYLLADLYSMQVSPEIERDAVTNNLQRINRYLSTNRIVKFHHTVQQEIFDWVKPVNYSLISVVRNPRDRVVSKAFHMRYGKKGEIRHFHSDQEAVIKCVEDPYFSLSNMRQEVQMQPGYSTRDYRREDLPYIWTTYEWMLEDIEREVIAITNFLGKPINEKRVYNVCRKHSFKQKTGREPGVEARRNRWRRKGIIGDWINWFTPKLLELTQEPQETYWEKLLKNRGEV